VEAPLRSIAGCDDVESSHIGLAIVNKQLLAHGDRL
jgi:hypothetical protein